MFKSYISSLLVVSCLTACSSSHTDKIRHQLGSEFNEVTYINAGGETKSKDRYKTFCTAIKENRYNKSSLQYTAMTSIRNRDDLNLVNAEIELANKECK